MRSIPSPSTHIASENNNAVESPGDYYKANGYYICKGLISTDKIDNLVAHYKKDIVPTKYPFFRQNTNAYERSKLTDHGYVKQSFLDIHDYKKFSQFSCSAREIYTCSAMKKALSEVAGFDSFNLMQTMLFDANAETVPHQDWWYLDTVPNGFLLGAWIALEDIDERAGRFYVVPKSHSVNLHADTPNLPHSEWLQRMQRYIDEHRYTLFAPALKKGDVLFWNSRTIHGALPTLDPSFSRKSLTAHYMPSELTFGNLFVKKEHVQYKVYNGMQFFRNQPDYSFSNKLKFAVKTGLYNSPRTMRMLRKVQKLVS